MAASYSQLEITNRFMVVRGDVHAIYLPPLALVMERDGKSAGKIMPSLNDLSAEAIPEAVRTGKTVDLMVRWRYVNMPLMTSSFVAPWMARARRT